METPISINIGSLIDKIVIVNNNKEETASEIAEKVREVLAKVIATHRETLQETEGTQQPSSTNANKTDRDSH